MTNRLQVTYEELARAMGTPAPPPLTPDQIASGTSLMSQLLAALGLAGNSGDPQDAADAADGDAQRADKTGDAMSKFPANEQNSSQELQQLMGTATQMPQQAMQAVGGLFSPFSQGLSQAMQQASQLGSQMASTLGKTGDAAGLGASLPAAALGAGEGALGAGAGAGAGLAGATTPTGNLGPPSTPPASTYPTSSPTPPVAAAGSADSAAGGRGSMGGMPMMPPGAMGGASGGDAKAETKRVVPPSVKNGAPVQGRVTAPQPAPEVVKRVAGKPVASRRLLPPETKPDEDREETDRNR